jgi:TolB-like protein/tetratricopeptide (TPR) repeat protein
VSDLLGKLKATADVAAAPTVTTSSQPEMPSIAVVPFRNLSTEKDTEYFSDGLSEDIMLDLAQIAELRVISRASAMTFKGTDEPLRDVGRRLNVEYILEGSVRRSGDSVRITAQLIDVAHDAHLWGERYSGSLERVFEFQEEISRKIVDALKVTLSPEESEQLSRRAIDDIEAYEIFLKARPYIWSYTEDGLEQAQRLLLEAIDRIGDNEVLYGAMGMTHWQYINAGVRPDELNLERVREYRDKVAAIRSDSSVGHFLEGLTNITSGTWASAIRSFKRSLAEQPGNADALFWMCLLYLFAGKSHKAGPYIENLLQIDPLTTQNQVLPGWVEVMDGRFLNGAELLRKLLETSPDHPVVLTILATLLARLEERERAFTLFGRLHELVPGSVFDGLARFYEGALLKDKESALAGAAETDLLNKAWWDWQLSWEVAAGYALLQETAEAMRWLRNAVSRGFTNYPFFSDYDPFLKSLREQSEFQELMDEVRTEWEAFDA